MKLLLSKAGPRYPDSELWTRVDCSVEVEIKITERLWVGFVLGKRQLVPGMIMGFAKTDNEMT